MSQNPNPAYAVNGRAKVQCGRLFYLPFVNNGVVGLGLSTVEGQRKSSRTTDARQDLAILAGSTDMATSKGLMRDGSGRAIWSNQDTALIAQFGRKDTARSWIHYPTPFSLKRGNTISLDVLNVGAETGGNAVFLCDPVENQPVTADLTGAAPYFLTVPLGLTGDAAEIRPVSTDGDNSPLIMWGCSTDLTSAMIRVTDAEREKWSSEYIPIWALAGGSQLNPARWPRPYLLPANGSLQIEVKNTAAAETGGYLSFLCSKYQHN